MGEDGGVVVVLVGECEFDLGCVFGEWVVDRVGDGEVGDGGGDEVDVDVGGDE